MMNSSEKQLRDTLGLVVPEAGKVNYSVKAGAGGGKTTMLSGRICRQIMEGTSIDQFVIITYTNAAATELRDKVAGRLRAELAKGNLNELEKERVTTALNTIELMQISTIHSFLFKILHENAVEANIAFDARMLESSEDEERKQIFFDKWYSKHYDQIAQFGDDWVHITKEGKETDYKRLVFKNMFFDLANVREQVVYDTSDHSADFIQLANSYISRWKPVMDLFKLEYEANWPLKKDGSRIANPKAVNDMFSQYDLVLGGAVADIEAAKVIATCLAVIKDICDKKKPFYKKGYSDACLDAVIPHFGDNELEWDFVKLYDEYLVYARKAALVAEYVCRMQKEYQKEIDAEALVLSNDDILYRADKLLREYPKILDALRSRYTKIYVDEFQDTTGLQTGIVKMLCEMPGTAIDAEELTPDKLVVVGDPKQSIYRFTGAEKAVYDTFDAFLGGLPDQLAQAVSLDTNFRSNQDIIQWVNQSFQQLMPGSYTPMETDWVVQEKKALHGVYSFYLAGANPDAEEEPEDYSKERDAKEVLNLVETLVGNPKFFLEECHRNADGSFGTPTLRTIQYSDIMIICRNTTNMANYVELFAASGIPVHVQGKFKVSKDQQLNNFVQLVEYFANHKSKKNRIQASQILQGIDATNVDAEALKTLREQLRELRKSFRDQEMNASAIVQYLLSREDLYLKRDRSYQDHDVRRHRIRLHQMVEKCLLDNDGDLSTIVDLMKQYLEEDVKREIPLESNENAVRLMNAHQSKGLTGQIVIIADRSNEEKCRYSGYKKDGKYYPAAAYSYSDFAAPSIYPTYGYDDKHLQQVFREEMEESIRLQYVAATRAAHALIIMPVIGKGNKNKNIWFTDPAYGYPYLKDIKTWIEKREQDTNTYSVEECNKVMNHPVINLECLAQNIQGADLDVLARKECISITPSSCEKSGVTGYQEKDKGYQEEERPKSVLFGTILHRMFELVWLRIDALKNMEAKALDKNLMQIVNQAVIESKKDLMIMAFAEGEINSYREFPYYLQDYVNYLRGIIEDYWDRVILPIANNAETCYPEYAFSFYVPEEDYASFVETFGDFLGEVEHHPGIWVNGKADLVVKEKDGAVKVYDYKSDARNGKALPAFEKKLSEKYAGQLALYQYAIGKAFAVKEVETTLIHLYK